MDQSLTRDSCDAGLEFASIAHGVGTKTHPDDVHVFEVRADLEVEETDQERDLAPDHARVLVTIAVQTPRAGAPVHTNHVRIILIRIQSEQNIIFKID